MTNLLERAEIRKETFYKLTNSADAPTAPSEGGRNLLKHNQIGKKGLSTFAYAGQTDSYDCIAPKGSNIWGYGIFYAERFAAIPAGKTLVFSMEVNPDVDCQWNNDVNNTCVGLSSNPYGNDNDDQSKRKNSDRNLKKGTWNQVWFSYTAKDETKDYTLYDATSNFGIVTTNLTADVHFQLRKVKAELAETATPYSKAPEDLGWSTATLVPTQEQRYLWKFEYIYYSDGSVEITQPTNISIAGADGTNGQTSHVHFAFADNATGGGFSLTTPKAYMGWYADFNETASTDPTKYRWGKWKGDQGAPGIKGDDGKTSYLHLAFASSADGKTGFSFTESGQQYQGYYTDFTQTSSTDPTKYTWMDRRAGVEVGGVNLLRNSKSFTGSNISGSAKLLTETYQGCAVRYLKTSAWGEIAQFSKCVVPEVNSTYVASFWAKGNGKIRAYFYGDPNYLPVLSGISNQNAVTSAGDGAIDFTVTEEWKRYWVTYKLKSSFPTTDTTVAKHFLLRHLSSTAEEEFWVAGYKLEEGNVPTPYTRNPDDIQSDIDSKADQALTQQQLEALEAKRQQMIVEIEAKATIEQISELQGYLNKVKQDDEEGRQKIAATATAIEERVRNIEPILTYSQKMQFIDTYITQGNGGMIIGANDSTTKVVVTPNRISFQDGGSEVAYISQSVLHIDNGVFTLSLQLGHFITRAHPKNQYVNATYFVK